MLYSASGGGDMLREPDLREGSRKFWELSRVVEALFCFLIKTAKKKIKILMNHKVFNSNENIFIKEKK